MVIGQGLWLKTMPFNHDHTGDYAQKRLTISIGASSNGRTQDFGSCCGGSTPPAPDVREQGTGIFMLIYVSIRVLLCSGKQKGVNWQR